MVDVIATSKKLRNQRLRDALKPRKLLALAMRTQVICMSMTVLPKIASQSIPLYPVHGFNGAEGVCSVCVPFALRQQGRKLQSP